MGKQEVSHQQVMSYLVRGGDTYASHMFHAFCFQEVLHTTLNLNTFLPEGTVEQHDGVEKESNDERQIVIDISSGKPVVTSDMLDYRMWPVEHPFDEMNLWEFIEQTRKVSHTTDAK